MITLETGVPPKTLTHTYEAIDVFVIKCQQSELLQLLDLNPCSRMRLLVHDLKMSLSRLSRL